MAGTLRIAGYDWDTGRELWTVRGLSRVVCMTPTIGRTTRCIVAGWSAGGEPGDRIRWSRLPTSSLSIDENKNGTLEEKECASSAALKTRFLQCDRDKDGHVTKAEYDEFEMLFDKSQNAVMAISPGGKAT